MDLVLPFVLFGLLALVLSIKNACCCKKQENELNYTNLSNTENPNSNSNDEIPPKYEEIYNS